MQSEPGYKNYLPTWGNMLFTLCMIGLLIVTQPIWADAKNNVSSEASTTSINYQGYLTDANGNPQNGSFDITFSLWDAASDGNLIWGTETHVTVPVSNGLFNVRLGSQTSGGIPSGIWSGDRYLEIEIEGETLSPREPFHTTPIFDHTITSDKLSLDHGQACISSTTIINTPGNWQVVDFPELNLSFSLNQTSQVLIWMEGLSYSNNASEILLAMDDTYQSAVQIPSGNIWADINGQRLIDLEAGTHTLKMHANSATASTIAVNGDFGPWRTCIYYLVLGE